MTDIGVMGQASWRGTTLQVGLVNGEGPNQKDRDGHLDLSVRVAQKAGPLTLSGSWQRGQRVANAMRDFRAGFATLTTPRVVFGYAVAKRDDRTRAMGRTAQRVDLRFPTKWVEPLFRLEWPHRYTFGLLRSFGWRGGIELEVRVQRDQAPVWCVGFQPAVDLLNL